MFSQSNNFGYSFTKKGTPKSEIKKGTPKSEIKKAKREIYLAIKRKNRGAFYVVGCDNPSCDNVFEYMYKHKESKAEELANAGWRRFNKTMTLCPFCREIQEKRMRQGESWKKHSQLVFNSGMNYHVFLYHYHKKQSQIEDQ